MLRCCLGAYGCPNHAWMPSLGAGLIRLSQSVRSHRIVHLQRSVLQRQHCRPEAWLGSTFRLRAASAPRYPGTKYGWIYIKPGLQVP